MLSQFCNGVSFVFLFALSLLLFLNELLVVQIRTYQFHQTSVLSILFYRFSTKWALIKFKRIFFSLLLATMEQTLLAKVMPTGKHKVRVMRWCHQLKTNCACIAFHLVRHVFRYRAIFIFGLL